MAPSNYHWINYDEDKMDKTFYTAQAARLGDRKHALAAELISLRTKLPDIRKTINMYVNDAIGYKMTPEQTLYYSDNCFGTADAISFRQDPVSGTWLLRIHDLKTGSTRTSMKQLEIYACLFCLEYGFDPADIEMELRIYKSDDVEIYVPDLDDLMHIIDRIKTFDKRIEEIKKEALQ
jgi:hypothetical protein